MPAKQPALPSERSSQAVAVDHKRVSPSKTAKELESDAHHDRMRMKKWLEAKQRRQVVDGDSGSVMSVVTSGDDEPRAMDADDSAYRGPARSRIGTIQSYRDAVLSPKRTRHSLVATNDEVGDRSSIPDGVSKVAASRDEETVTNKHRQANPLVAYSDDDDDKVDVAHPKKDVKRLVAYSDDDDDDDGFTVVDRSSSAKRRRRPSGRDVNTPTSKRVRRDERGIPSPPPLGSDDDLPTMMEVFDSTKAKATLSSNRHRKEVSTDLSDFKPRRLFRRELEAREHAEQDALIDDEAMLDTFDGAAVSADEVIPDENEYDYADSFIDDGSEADGHVDSDSSMRSAYSRKARKARAARRVSAGRLSRADSVDDIPLSDLKKATVLAPAFKSAAAKTRGRVKRDTSAMPFPLSSDVLEISSGSESEPARSAPPVRRRATPPVVKMEPGVQDQLPKSRPKPRPVTRKPKTVDTAVSVVPDRTSASGKASKTNSSADIKTPVKGKDRTHLGESKHVDGNPIINKMKDKGKARAMAQHAAKSVSDRDSADDDLHPEEKEQLLKAIRQSQLTTPASKRLGESSSSGSASSSAPAPPVTPSPTGRVSIADFIARANPGGQSPVNPVPTAYLEDLNTFYRCRTLPAPCEVYNEETMDPVLRPVYRDLPNLLMGDIRPWTDLPGKGNMQFSMWAEWCPDMSGGVAYDAINFVEAGNIRNPSRVSPLDFVLRSIPQTTNRYNFYCATNPPLPLVATSCVFIDASQLVTPSTSGLRQKYIRGNFHCYEWDRFCGFVRTASGFPTIYAQLARDCLQFSTRATPRGDQGDNQAPPDQNNHKGKGRGTRETPAGLFKASPSRASYNRVSAETFSLASDAVVPVYDARSLDSLDFKAVLPRLADSLPLYTGGEIPFGSFAMIGYTMTIYRSSAGNWTLGCNLLWAILVGTPHD